MIKNKINKTLAISMLSLTLFSSSAHAFEFYDNSNILDGNISAKIDLKASSGVKEFSVNGKKYANSTYALSQLGKAYGGTNTFSYSGVVQTGNLGAHANLYNSSGSVVSTANWKYNTSSATSLQNETAKVSAKGQYYVKGTSKVYNGNGYTTVGANQSPIVTVKSLGIEISDEELKEREYLYSNYNMISAVGEGDLEGYVLLSDLYDEENQPNTPEEAIKYMQLNERNKFKMIPLYSNDGETIIGEYKINL